VQFDRAKFKTVILYACSKCEQSGLGVVKLHKLLYFADMLRYAEIGAPITGATYRKRSFGPSCDNLLPILREMANEGAVEVREFEYFGYRKNVYVACREPEAGRLSKGELELLSEVIDFVCMNNAMKTIGEYNLDRPWEMAEFGSVLPYHSAFHLFPLQVSQDAMEWASGEVDKIETERSRDETLGGAAFRDFRSRVLEARRK